MEQFNVPLVELLGPDKNIIHLNFQSQYEVTSMFMRMQEYYESDIPSIYRKVFTLEQFMDAYSEKFDNFTYTSDWAGFNVPSNIVEEFFKKYKNKLLDKEIKLQGIINKNKPKSGKYYIIGTYKGPNNAIEHEISHAMWFLNPKYKKAAKALIQKLPKNQYKHLKEQLNLMGYRDSVIDDEIQAYLSTSDMIYLDTLSGSNINWNLVLEFQQLYREYK